MSNKLIFNVDKATICEFCERVIHMNTMLAVLPTLRDVQGAPPEMDRGDEPLKPYKLCQLLLGCLPQRFEQMYWSRRKARHFAIDVETLVEELVVIEPEYKQQRQLHNQQQISIQRQIAGQKLEQPIPRKRQQQGSPAKSADKRSKKLCELCAQWMPKCKHSHNTADCRIFNKDGSRKQQDGEGKRKGAFAQGKLPGDFLECFAQMKKSNEAMMKALDRQEKRRSRHSGRRDPPRDGRRRSRSYSSDGSDESY